MGRQATCNIKLVDETEPVQYSLIMSQESLYGVLMVDRNATLDEIKLAFKKRALQVHPDKGGSKEAFHLVYQALETLADPEARRKYDNGLAASKPAAVQHPPQSGTGRKKKTSKKRAHPNAMPQKPPKSRKKQTADGTSTEPTAPETQQSKQTKLLIKIRDLLKQLPRDVRNEVITKQFSQKQRLILEKWMVDASSGQPRGKDEGPLQILDPTDHTCKVLALPATSMNCSPATFGTSQKQRAKRKMRKKKRDSHGKMHSRGGYLRKNGRASYTAQICFDSIEMHTRNCNLQTGLEFLMVLTAVKQKMRDSAATDVSFEERLWDALASSAKEHGKDPADLKISFMNLQAAGFFIGADLKTPSLRTIEKLGRTRRCLEVFRQYAKNIGARNIYWQYSPAHLQDAWERFQKAVADAWEIAGVNGAAILKKIRALHEARSELRTTQLQRWERGHMAIQDKNKHRPRKLRQRNVLAHLERRERRQMALQDKNKHRPRKLQEHLNLGKFPSENRSSTQLALKRLLVRWGRMLNLEARFVDKERRRVLQQRKAQRRKAREERRQLEALNRTRLREERLRRAALRKRMRTDLTMDDILGQKKYAEVFGLRQVLLMMMLMLMLMMMMMRMRMRMSMRMISFLWAFHGLPVELSKNRDLRKTNPFPFLLKSKINPTCPVLASSYAEDADATATGTVIRVSEEPPKKIETHHLH